MPDINSGIALGELAGGIGRALQQKKQREYEEQAKQHDLVQSMVAAGLRDGTIKDPNAAFQFLVSGGSGKGKKGKELPPFLTSLIGATKKLVGQGGSSPDQGTTLGGQARPSFQQPQQSPVQFTTQPERTAAENEASLSAAKRTQAEVTEPAAQARHQRKLEEIEAQNKARYGPGTLVWRINTAFDAFREREGRDPTPEEQNKLTDEARGAWQSAGRKESDYKTFEQTWLKDASANGPLTPQQQKEEMLKARKAWALAGQSETPGQKLSRQEALEKFKNQLVATTPDEVKGLSQSVTIGDTTTPYLDLGSGALGGVKEKAAAAKLARAQGIIPVSSKEAEQLASAGAANDNLTGFLDQIKSRLPSDAASRPITSVENKMAQFFQTDEELASAISWDLTIFPMLRAMSVTNRINQQEMNLAIRSRPTINDTVGTAAKKVAVIQRILGNGAKQILNRGELTTPSKSDRGQSATVPPAVSSVLKGKKAGHYKLSDGSEWDVAADGSIKASKKAA